VLLEPGDTFWVEDPGHASLGPLLRALHANVVGVPFDDQGLDVAAGRRLAPRAAAVYLHPLAQFPLGIRTGTERRAELLEWADECGAWVVEGNMNDEIAHDAQAPVPLQALDRSDRVLTMGTFEGILYPSLRLAYLVVPDRLVDVFVAMRGLMGDHSSTAMQLALTWFIDEGHMSQHLRRLRRISAERRAVLEAAARRHLPPWARLGPTGAGTHASIFLPTSCNDLAIVRTLRQRCVLSFALSTVAIGGQGPAGVVIGYAAFEPEQIEAAFAHIGAVLAAAPPSNGSLTVPAAPHARGNPGAARPVTPDRPA
jgi:GntR family transcriptional regulator/MocR family aminotransferase